MPASPRRGRASRQRPTTTHHLSREGDTVVHNGSGWQVAGRGDLAPDRPHHSYHLSAHTSGFQVEQWVRTHDARPARKAHTFVSPSLLRFGHLLRRLDNLHPVAYSGEVRLTPKGKQWQLSVGRHSMTLPDASRVVDTEGEYVLLQGVTDASQPFREEYLVLQCRTVQDAVRLAAQIRDAFLPPPLLSAHSSTALAAESAHLRVPSTRRTRTPHPYTAPAHRTRTQHPHAAPARRTRAPCTRAQQHTPHSRTMVVSADSRSMTAAVEYRSSIRVPSPPCAATKPRSHARASMSGHTYLASL